MSKPLKVFITYAHKNTEAKDKLITYLAVLKQNGLIDVWHDNEILPGDKWRDEIFSNLADSDLLFYLTCPYSLASENCNKELTAALNPNIRVIPIILEHCDWQNHQLSEFQALPDKGKPINDINEWNPESKGWQNVVDGIRKVVNKMQSRVQPSPTITPEEKETLAFLALQRGNFMMMLDQIGEALKDYSRSIELYPNYAQAYSNRGAVYLAKGKYPMTVEDCNKAIALKSHYAHAYNNRGAAYGAMGNIKQSIKDCTTAIQFKPKYASAFTNRGNAYQLQGNFKNAIKDYDKAIQLEPNDPGKYSNRGTVYARNGESEKAIKDFTKAIDLNPNYAEAYNNRGEAHRESGEFDAALTDLNKSIQLKANNASAHFNRGLVYYQKGVYEESIKDYSVMIKQNPKFAPAHYFRGLVLLHLKEWEKAKSDLITVKNMGCNIIDSFRNDYENVKDFEEKHNVKLPADIVAMLTPPQA